MADYEAGLVGPMPYWARIIMAAKWLKVAPWELMKQDEPDFWLEAAGVLSSAESDAMEAKRAQNSK